MGRALGSDADTAVQGRRPQAAPAGIDDTLAAAGLHRFDARVSFRDRVIRAVEREIRRKDERRGRRSSCVSPGDFLRGDLKDATRHVLNSEFDAMVAEGLLEQRFILCCPECGEFENKSYKDPFTLAQVEAEIGKQKRCKDCKETYTVSYLDAWVNYTPTAAFPFAPERDRSSDRDRIEKQVKKRLKAGSGPFYASEIAAETGIDIATTHAELVLLASCGEIAELDEVRCPACAQMLCDDPQQIYVAYLNHLNKCESCGHGPYLIGIDHVFVSFGDKSLQGRQRGLAVGRLTGSYSVEF